MRTALRKLKQPKTPEILATKRNCEVKFDNKKLSMKNFLLFQISALPLLENF